MKKKSIIFIIAMLLLVCAAGGTYAYFTTGTVTHNVISSGRVDVELVELADLDGTEFENIRNALPGGSYDKIVLVKNTGSADAWVRVAFVKSAVDKSGSALDADMVGFDTVSDGWSEKDGWFYYDSVLSPGESSKPIVGKVVFPTGMGNSWQNSRFMIDVTMQSVQVANNGNTVFDALGWPESKGGN